MGWFDNDILWECIECGFERNKLIENNSFHKCDSCGSEYYVWHDDKQISVMTKQRWIDEQIFNFPCISCNIQNIEFKYSDEAQIIRCQECDAVHKVWFENDEYSAVCLDIESMRQEEEYIEGQLKINTVVNSFNQRVSKSFPVTACQQCDDNLYGLLRFNSRFTSAQLQCNTCGKKLWVNSGTGDPVSIQEDYNIVQDILLDLPETEACLAGIYTIPEIIIIGLADTRSDTGKARRQGIPKNVKQEVWQRDSGKCVECGSNEKLEYDHIIPVAKGGANTVRNIQLLCEPCNRTKSAKIQ